MRGSLDDLYLEYLYDRVGLYKRGRNRTYYQLFGMMYAQEFLALVPHDGNRAEDGKELRWEFVDAARIQRVPAPWLYRPCSTLEMFIAVSKRLAFLTDGDPREWFKQLLFNTGLIGYPDITFDECRELVEQRLDNIVRRAYAANGDGGLFPLRNPATNQQHEDIWHQMNAWLIERDRREG